MHTFFRHRAGGRPVLSLPPPPISILLGGCSPEPFPAFPNLPPPLGILLLGVGRPSPALPHCPRPPAPRHPACPPTAPAFPPPPAARPSGISKVEEFNDSRFQTIQFLEEEAHVIESLEWIENQDTEITKDIFKKYAGDRAGRIACCSSSCLRSAQDRRC